jgi:hypothetical protein
VRQLLPSERGCVIFKSNCQVIGTAAALCVMLRYFKSFNLILGVCFIFLLQKLSAVCPVLGTHCSNTYLLSYVFY